MKIYLPLKNDILDHGDANSVWTNPYVSGGLPLFKNIGGVKCAEFSNEYLQIQTTSLITGLTNWTIQCWFYPYKNSSPTGGLYKTLISNLTPYQGSTEPSGLYIIFRSATFQMCGNILDSNISLNKWHQIYATCDGTNIEISYDNQSTVTIPRGSRGFSQGLMLGNTFGGYGYGTSFEGGITQFQLSDKYNDTKLSLRDKLIYIADNNEVWGMV